MEVLFRSEEQGTSGRCAALRASVLQYRPLPSRLSGPAFRRYPDLTVLRAFTVKWRARHTPPLVAMVSTQQHFNFSADILQVDLEMLATVSVAWGEEEKEVTSLPGWC